MVAIVPFDPNTHMEEFRQMNIETIQWYADELNEKYQVDMMSFVHQTTVTEWVDDNLEPYLNLKPPEGIVLILEVEGEVAGMLALWEVNDDMGEIQRMWIRPKFRGKGYSTLIFNKLLNIGREFGYIQFRLATPLFADATQHVYRKAGFKEIEEYRDTNPELSKYWICMELKD